jgi:histidinol dehydrogenase
MKIFKHPSREQWNEFLKRPLQDLAEITKTVNTILENVKTRGNQALLEYTASFDQVKLDSVEVTETEINTCEDLVSHELKQAMKAAYKNILTYHTTHRENYHVVETVQGVRCWRRSVPIDKVGLYIPSGTAPLFSTVLMLGIPAKLMGCKEIVLCVPPQADGSVHPAILYAAKMVGLKKIFKVGGAQAIAAMAYGTESIPKVYKIFGPGNAYVTAAKQMVFYDGVSIDMPAGPSELMVVADDSMPVAYVAADLLSQAEHGIDSQVILVTFKEDYLKKVQKHISEQLKELPRKEIIEKALENSLGIIVKTQDDARDIVNEFAPEHLIVGLRNCNAFATEITNASAIYLGNFSPEAAGNYATGPNHTLPTAGFAKMFSGLMLESFAKRVTYQQLTAEGLSNLSATVETLAEAEGLIAHKNAVTIRLNDIKTRDNEQNK